MFDSRRSFGLMLVVVLPQAGLASEVSEATLRAADAEQMRIIVEGDAKAQQDFMHPDYIINGPMNRVVRKPVVVEMLAQGKMASDRFERVIEGLVITGNVGITMGREVVHPLPGSQLGALHGDRVLNRRFTNVFLFEDGRWRFLARQATIVDEGEAEKEVSMGRSVIVAYKPKPGKEQELLAVVKKHLEVLRGEALVTDRPSHVMRGADGTVIEVFEWRSAEAIARAHSNPAVQALWGEFGEVCEYVPLASLPEAQQPFAELESVSW